MAIAHTVSTEYRSKQQAATNNNMQPHMNDNKITAMAKLPSNLYRNYNKVLNVAHANLSIYSINHLQIYLHILLANLP